MPKTKKEALAHTTVKAQVKQPQITVFSSTHHPTPPHQVIIFSLCTCYLQKKPPRASHLCPKNGSAYSFECSKTGIHIKPSFCKLWLTSETFLQT